MTICDICRVDLAGVQARSFEFTDNQAARMARLDHLCGQCFGSLVQEVKQLISDKQSDGLILMKRKLLSGS